MSKRRRKQIVERIKSLLIVLLSCSAVYLVVLTQSIAVPSGLLSRPSTGGGGLAVADPAETARPLRMAAVIPAGGNEVQRFGVQYSEADTADLFQQAYTILVEALSRELEGILLWCLEGLQRLLQSGYKFTVSPRAAANLEAIKRNSNNVLDFLDSEGYFRYKADFSVSSRDLYDLYKMWCEDNACHPVSAARLSSEVNQNAARLNLEPTNNIYLPGGRRVRGFLGIEALVHPCP